MGVGGGCGCVGGRFFHGFGEAEADLSAAERGLAEADGAVVIFHGGADDVEADTAAARFGGLERGFIFFNAGPAGAAVVDNEDDGFLPGDDVQGDFADFAIGFGDGFGAVAKEVGEGELELGVIALDATRFGGVLVADVDAISFEGITESAFEGGVEKDDGCVGFEGGDGHRDRQVAEGFAVIAFTGDELFFFFFTGGDVGHHGFPDGAAVRVWAWGRLEADPAGVVMDEQASVV